MYLFAEQMHVYCVIYSAATCTVFPDDRWQWQQVFGLPKLFRIWIMQMYCTSSRQPEALKIIKTFCRYCKGPVHRKQQHKICFCYLYLVISLQWSSSEWTSKVHSSYAFICPGFWHIHLWAFLIQWRWMGLNLFNVLAALKLFNN